MFRSGPLAGRWLEVAGSGQVHPNVVRNYGLDPETATSASHSASAPTGWRCCATASTDMRLLYDGDLRFLKQFA